MSLIFGYNKIHTYYFLASFCPRKSDMLRRTLLILFGIGLIFCGSDQARSDEGTETIEPSSLLIQLVGSGEDLSRWGGDQEWKKACETLGSQLLANRVEGGVGIFKYYRCQWNPKLESASKENPWTLVIERNQASMVLKLYFVRRPSPLAETTIEIKHPGLDLLSRQTLARLISVHLLSQTPMMWARPLKYISGKQARTEKAWDPFRPQIMELFGSFDLFTLQYDAPKNSWIPEAIGTASLRKVSGDQSPGYLITAELSTGHSLSPDAIVWGRPKSDPLTLQKKLAFAFQEDLKIYKKNSFYWRFSALKKNLFAQSSHLGIRYGSSLSNDEFFRKFRMFSILLAFRQAPVDGLTLRYDKWPTINSNLDLGVQEFGSERILLGWAFKIPSSWIPLIDRIDFSPQVGRWSIVMSYQDKFSSGLIRRSKFNEDNTWSAEGELGIEKSISLVRLRLWTARALGINLVKSGQSQTLKSTRIGADLIIGAPTTYFSHFMANLRFLGFIQLENFLVDREFDAENDANRINQLEFSALYVGGGLGITL
jgi:hypothetical protein